MCLSRSVPAWLRSKGHLHPSQSRICLFWGLFSISSPRIGKQHPDFQEGEALLGRESEERRRGMAMGDAAAQ